MPDQIRVRTVSELSVDGNRASWPPSVYSRCKSRGAVTGIHGLGLVPPKCLQRQKLTAAPLIRCGAVDPLSRCPLNTRTRKGALTRNGAVYRKGAVNRKGADNPPH